MPPWTEFSRRTRSIVSSLRRPKNIFRPVRVFYAAINLADVGDEDKSIVWDILHPVKWHSVYEQVEFTKSSDRRAEFPMLPHVLLERGYRGWTSYNMSWAMSRIDNYCFAVSDVEPGCFLGILPGKVHYRGFLSANGIQGPDGLWLEPEEHGALGCMEGGDQDEANVILGWDTHADACTPSDGKAQVLVFCVKPIAALQMPMRYDPRKDLLLC